MEGRQSRRPRSRSTEGCEGSLTRQSPGGDQRWRRGLERQRRQSAATRQAWRNCLRQNRNFAWSKSQQIYKSIACDCGVHIATTMPRERTTEAIIMKRLSSSILLAAALLLTVPFSQATPITFIASLTGASESPPTGSPGIGFATVLLDLPSPTMQVIGSYSGLLSPTTASHLPCCTPPGTNAIVATGVPPCLGLPLCV